MSDTVDTTATNPPTTRDRILRAAADLLAEGGRAAVSTRSVSETAGVQPPAIYRLFGDMRGLLDAVASHGFAEYLRSKTDRSHAVDPVDDLRRGWDLHVAFGLANPAIYILIYGEPQAGDEPAAAKDAAAVLRELVQRVAEVGRLRVSVERAAAMIHAAGMGTTLALLEVAPEDRDPVLSEANREAVLAAVTTDADGAAPPAGPQRAASRAVALKAVLDKDTAGFNAAELGLLADWLDRIAHGADPSG